MVVQTLACDSMAAGMEGDEYCECDINIGRISDFVDSHGPCADAGRTWPRAQVIGAVVFSLYSDRSGRLASSVRGSFILDDSHGLHRLISPRIFPDCCDREANL